MEKSPKESSDTLMSSIAPEDDHRRHYKGSIVDINLRPASDSTAIRIKKDVSVYDILEHGPRSVTGEDGQQLRWIHLPANNMAWTEELFARLHQEQLDGLERNSGDTKKLTRFDRVLRHDKWRHVFHGRKSADIHGRFIVPHATQYSSTDVDDSDSEESEPRWHDANITSLYLPYLHWESYNSWRNRQRHIACLKRKLACGCPVVDDEQPYQYDEMKEALLLHSDLLLEHPLHDRRTLDQSYFYHLGSVGGMDKDQVIGQHTRDLKDPYMSNRKMMMVDQLWLWVIDGKTLVTAFPNAGKSWQKQGDVLNLIQDSLHDAIQQRTVKSLNGLLAYIIDQCTGVFHRSDIHPDLAFFEFIADEIGKAKTELEGMYQRFHQISESIESFWTKEGTTVAEMSSKLDELFSIKEEIRLNAQVENIVADLDKIDFLCSQQEKAVHNLITCSKQSRSLDLLIETLNSRRKAWDGMAQLTKATRKSLHSLLDLKQRQATVGEARSVRYSIELSARQGRSIMLLTVFTVFFLPISVMAAIFGMNAAELNEGKIKVKTISAIVFPTTVTLVLGALAFAFNDESRGVLKNFSKRLSRKLHHHHRSEEVEDLDRQSSNGRV